MPAYSTRGDDWRAIVRAIKEGREDEAVTLLTERDRRSDDYFSVIDRSVWTPTILQSTNTITYDATDSLIQGIRIGPFVWLNFYTVLTAVTGAATGIVVIDLPKMLPCESSSSLSGPVGGKVWVYDASTSTGYHGAALVGQTNVIGWRDSVTSQMMAAPAVALAVGDRVGMSIHYMTTASTV